MKFWLIYIFVFSVGLMSFTIMVTKSSEPEMLIAGQWKELTWSYEDEQSIESSGINRQYEGSLHKVSNSEDILFHQGETWIFYPDGKLCLKSDSSERIVHWSIKGRGNILQVKYANAVTEKFILSKLDNNNLVLDFESDIQARGIANLTFEKCK
ncbi:MAG TPA: hypothetical protein PKC39_04365 [Ferruginibacter sp.]|nr:hypothetical protein [Ferruginibacter sp.]HMP20173.1 hypothetical protein [Ferruginibacter sp.]